MDERKTLSILRGKELLCFPHETTAFEEDEQQQAASKKQKDFAVMGLAAYFSSCFKESSPESDTLDGWFLLATGVFLGNFQRMVSHRLLVVTGRHSS